MKRTKTALAALLCALILSGCIVKTPDKQTFRRRAAAMRKIQTPVNPTLIAVVTFAMLQSALSLLEGQTSPAIVFLSGAITVVLAGLRMAAMYAAGIDPRTMFDDSGPTPQDTPSGLADHVADGMGVGSMGRPDTEHGDDVWEFILWGD